MDRSERRSLDEWAKTFDRDGGFLEKINDNIILKKIIFDNKTVLDLGCGTGRVLPEIAKKAKIVYGIDVSFRMLQKCAKRVEHLKNLFLIQADLNTFNFPRETVDIVFSAHTLHHLNLKDQLKKIKSTIRPGGELLIIDLYNHSISAIQLGFYFRYFFRYGISDTLKLLYRTHYWGKYFSISKTFRTHVINDTYLDIKDVQLIANNILPGADVSKINSIFYKIYWKKCK